MLGRKFFSAILLLHRVNFFGSAYMEINTRSFCSMSTKRRRQRGQILPIAMLGLAVLSVVMLVMFNAGQKITDKSKVANAADAAAYSGAVWTARHLNFMAYTNRAMIANHVAVGHFISYISWFRYVENVVDKIADYTSWIPYWGEVIEIIQEVIDEVSDVNDDLAPTAIEIVDALNSVYRAAQAETKASLAFAGLTELMRETAKTYDQSIRINDDGELGALPSEIGTPLKVKVNYQLVQLPNFVKRYTASDDDGRINGLISSSYTAESDTRNWIAGNRGWRFNLTPLLQLRKYGSTDMTQDDSSADWNASDEFQFCAKHLTWRGWKTKCTKMASGDASASEFDSSYAGVENYYELDGKPTDDHSLQIAAVATKRQSEVATKELFEYSKSQQSMTVAALAKVEFKRPVGFGFSSIGSSKVEYASLFNPFWSAHLVAFPIPGFG